METNGGEIATWVCLSHDVLSFHLFAASECGFPGVPSNGSLVGSSMLFHPGEEASYLCHEGFVLFGDDKRTCSENGTWNGPMPNCREYIHYITALRIRSSAIFCQIFSWRMGRSFSYLLPEQESQVRNQNIAQSPCTIGCATLYCTYEYIP